MTEDPLPPLREVIARHGLAPKKSLGQNFLFDLNLTRRIARAAAPLMDGTVVEIGPGPGGLTRALLMEGATHIIAIERDGRAIAALVEIAAAFPGRLDIVPGDALAVDWATLVKGPAKIVANLPYNIATPRRLAHRWAMAAVVFFAHPDVPEGSGRAYCGQARRQGLWPPQRAVPVAL